MAFRPAQKLSGTSTKRQNLRPIRCAINAGGLRRSVDRGRAHAGVDARANNAIKTLKLHVILTVFQYMKKIANNCKVV